jgi:hypothetical protein
VDIGSLLLGLALLVIVAAYVARPLFERAPAQPAEAAPHAELLAERENVLAALRELDFDYATGKLDEADYQGQRARLVSQGAEVLRQLDAAGAADSQPAPSLDEQMEAAIAALRRTPASNGKMAAPATTPERACPNCGAEAAPDDRFCARCGARLETAETP